MTGNDQPIGKLELIAVRSFKSYDEMYKIVDFLNKTLSHKNLTFGISKDKGNESMRISIYEVR
ncbi:MAG: YpmA family protein [Peptococcaceae bacterium]|nr:YpmA family protein [Peptococcaceae bacterium]